MPMGFELNYGDIGILFFLTLGPLKAILPFARATRGTEPAFQRAVAWQATAIATAIVLVVALLGPLVLTNWHVSPPAIIITGAIILFYQALRIVAQTPPAVPASSGRESSPSPPSPAIAVFPIAIPAIVTAPGIAAIATIVVVNRDDLFPRGDCHCILDWGDGAQPSDIAEHRSNPQARFGRSVAGGRMGVGGAAGFAGRADGDL
jgi:small neutral amino acid transporter SnatA (MarC family)